MINNNDEKRALNLNRVNKILKLTQPLLKTLGFIIIEKDNEFILYSLTKKYIGCLSLTTDKHITVLEAETPKGVLILRSELIEEDFNSHITKTTIEYYGVDRRTIVFTLNTDNEDVPLEIHTVLLDAKSDYLKTAVTITPNLINIVLNNPENLYPESLAEFCLSRELYYSIEEDQSNLMQMHFGSWETTPDGKESKIILNRFLGNLPAMFSLKFSNRISAEDEYVHENLLECTKDKLPALDNQLLSASRNKALINHSLQTICNTAPGFDKYLANNFPLLKKVQSYNLNNHAIPEIEEIFSQAAIPECDFKEEKEARIISWFEPNLL